MKKEYKIIGRSELVAFPDVQSKPIPARIDTGAKTSALWASEIVQKDKELSFMLFDKTSPFYTGEHIVVPHFEKRLVASSNGAVQERYAVRLLVKIKGKKIRGYFTLADRSQQAYPVLIGRNVLRGKFLVDVQTGHPDIRAERRRHVRLRKLQKEAGL